MKLRGAGYHHFAFVTAGGRTQAIVDGKHLNGIGDDRTPTPGVAFGYRPAVPDGLPLTFGCAEGPTAAAWVSAFRIWGTALAEDDVAIARKSTGPVMQASELDPRLLAYSLFTDRAKEVRLAGAPIRFTDFRGAGGGTPFFYRRPPGQELRAIYIRSGGEYRLAPPMVEFDAPSRLDELTSGPALADLTLPTILPRRSTDPSGEKAAYVLAKIGEWTRTPRSEASAAVVEQRLRAAFTRFRMEERARAFGGTDAKMVALGDFNESGYKGFAVALRTGERLHEHHRKLRHRRHIGGHIWNGRLRPVGVQRLRGKATGRLQPGPPCQNAPGGNCRARQRWRAIALPRPGLFRDRPDRAGFAR